jgi:hypothetical protein
MGVGDIYSLAIDQDVHGVACVNVFHFEQTGPGAADDENELIDAFESDCFPAWQAATSTQWSAACARARQVSGSGAFPEVLQIIPGVAGALIGEALPANAVAVISWYSQTYTKAGRGRSFFSGIRLADEDENTWIVAQQALLATLAGAITNTITDAGSGATFKQVIWGGTPATEKTVVKYEVRPQVRKLRSRTTRSCLIS